MNPSLKKTDVLIIGAGFAGLATALQLSRKRRGRLLIIEQDDQLGGYASGRNAGMIRQAISDPIIARLAHTGRLALGRLRGRKDWRGLGLRENGSLLLANRHEFTELGQIVASLRKEGVASRWFSRKEVAKKVSVLEGGDFEKGLFCPSDAALDIHTLLRGFVRSLRRRGVLILLGHRLESIWRRQDGFEVRARGRAFFAGKVVNAAGAWAGIVGEKAKAVAIPFKAYRRHLFLSKTYPQLKKNWPFVWDISHDFYFRPDGNSLLLSPCDKFLFNLKPGTRCDVRAVDPSMEKVLFEKLEAFGGCFGTLVIKERKAGLRTMVPDGRFVIGEDPRVQGFYWVAGLGGHGVTTAFAVGELASDIILGRRADKDLMKAFSPGRFSSK